MAVFFVFRSHYDEPSGKLLRRFEDATVLDWFRNHWGLVDEDYVAHERTGDLLGYPVDVFSDFFQTIFEQDLPAPETDEQLEQCLRDHVDPETPLRFGPHHLTILSMDECDMEVCSYLFDDVYLAQHADRAAYLLHKSWKLPGRGNRRRKHPSAEVGGFEPDEPIEALEPAGPGSGTTFGVVLYYDYENNGPLSELWGPIRIDGVRLPDLASYLSPAAPPRFEDYFLLLLRSQLFAEPFTTNPLEEGFRQDLLGLAADAGWQRRAEAAWPAYCDWLQEQQERPVGLLFLEQALKALTQFPVAHLPSETLRMVRLGPIGSIRQWLTDALEKAPPDEDQFPLPNKCRVHVEEHLAQLCLNTEHWRTFRRAELYHQWIFFDDVWAAAHPILANAILRYASCWDVLSPDGPHD